MKKYLNFTNGKSKESNGIFMGHRQSGITLIALIVTIIVLIILAGISIGMLAGDNGILQKATDAKEKTERQSVIEQARIDVLGYQTENKGGDLEKSQLKSVLDTYFKSVPDLTDMSESEILNKQLQTLDKYGNHSIAIKEIFDGKLSGVNQTKTVTADEINAKIGTVVTGYDAQNLEWQVYYADDIEIFLISKTVAKTNYSVPLKAQGKQENYLGSEDVKNSAYGSKWNKLWLDKCTENCTNNNAKATAYLCDPNNWNEYVTGPATYAVGAPTLELLVASWNQSQKASLSLKTNTISKNGYDGYETCEEFAHGDTLTEEKGNGIYYTNNYYFLASPVFNYEDSLLAVGYGLVFR